MANLTHIIEALLFSSDSPLSVKQLKDFINEEKEFTGVSADVKGIENSLAELKSKYDNDGHSFGLIQVAGGYRFATKPYFNTWLAKLNKERLKRKLSQSAVETLSIIAYNQPITRSEIEAIRGVNVDYIVGSLLEKDLVTIKGRADTPGRPMLFGTTDRFLEILGINSLEQLPPLKEISEVIKTGPPEGVTQSDIDFFEEINQMKAKAEGGDGQSVPLSQTEPESEELGTDSDFSAEDKNSLGETSLDNPSQTDDQEPEQTS